MPRSRSRGAHSSSLPSGIGAVEELALLAKEGDPIAMERLVSLLQIPLQGFLVLNFFLSQEDARDVLQEAFSNATHRIHRWDPDRGTYRTWVTAIVRNCARDRSRKLRRRPNEVPFPANFDIPATAMPYAESIIDPIMREALNHLTIPQKEAVWLHHVVGMSYEEIADVLHEPQSTIRGRVRDGLAKLRHALTDTTMFTGETLGGDAG